MQKLIAILIAGLIIMISSSASENQMTVQKSIPDGKYTADLPNGWIFYSKENYGLIITAPNDKAGFSVMNILPESVKSSNPHDYLKFLLSIFKCRLDSIQSEKKNKIIEEEYHKKNGLKVDVTDITAVFTDKHNRQRKGEFTILINKDINCIRYSWVPNNETGNSYKELLNKIISSIKINDTSEKTEENSNQANILGKAENFINQKKYSLGKDILKEYISKMPANWKPIIENPNRTDCYMWNKEDFLKYVQYRKEKNDIIKDIYWVNGSYSKAYYLLAYAAFEQEDINAAEKYIDKALTLDPSNPNLLSEKGFLLASKKCSKDAYKYYSEALKCPWITDSQKAIALRGQAYQLVELNRLDEAEKVLIESLKLEPNNKHAITELAYIKRLKAGK